MALQLGELTAILSADTSDYVKGFKDASSAAKKWESDTVSASKAVGKIVTGVALGIGAALLAAGAKGLKMAADMETTATSFKVLLGSGEAATQMMKDLKKFAAETPFEFPEIAKASKSLLAFGVTAGDIPRTLQMLGDVASGLNIPFSELSDIYGKIKVQGRLFAEDINQLQGRGIPVVQELAKQFGVNEEAIRGMVEKGQIGFPEIEKAFKALTGEGGKFQGMMSEQSKTVNGLISTLRDNLGAVLINIGAKMITAFDLQAKLASAIAALDQFVAVLEKGNIGQTLDEMIPDNLEVTIIAVAGALVGGMIPALIASTTAAGGAAVAFWAAAAPLLPFVVAGAAVAAVAYEIYKNWDQVTQFFKGWYPVIFAAFGPLPGLVAFIVKNWDEIKTRTMEIWNGIIQFINEWFPLFLAALGPMGTIVTTMIAHWEGMKSGTITILEALYEFEVYWIKRISDNIASWDIWSYAAPVWEFFKTKVIGTLTDLEVQLFEAGKQAVQGFVEGLKSGIGYVWDAAISLARTANNAIKSSAGLDEHSPSKTMLKIGEDAVAGFVKGITANVDKIQKAALKMSKALTISTEQIEKQFDDIVYGAEKVNVALEAMEQPRVLTVVMNAIQNAGGSAGDAAGQFLSLGQSWGSMMTSFAMGGVGGIIGGIAAIPGIIKGVKQLWSSFSGKKKVAAFYEDIAQQSEANRQAARANMQPYKDYAAAIRDFSKNSLIEIRGLAEGSVRFLENLDLVGTYEMVSKRIRRYFHKSTYWAQLWSYSFDQAGADAAKVFLDRFMEIASGLSSSVGNAFSSGIKAFLSGKSDWVTTLREGIRNAIIDAITSAVLQATIIKGYLGNLLGQLASGLTAGEDVSAIIGMIGKTIPELAARLENVLTPLKNALMGTFGVPAMASGGIVSRPTMALIGEAGPEAVVPLSKMESMGGEQTIIIQIDGRTITQAVVKNMPSFIRMKTGVSL